MRLSLIALFTASLVAFFALGCEGAPDPAPDPEPEIALVHGNPCEVALEENGAADLFTDGGNFFCADDGITLLHCRCDAYENGNECPEQKGTLQAQSLLDDCSCGDWFEGRCPVE